MTPARFGRYEVRRVLGRGGMGVVYEGQDPQIDRPVAIKTIALEALSDDEAAQFEARFRAEMRSTGRLLHQNIVALYDAGRDDGMAYIVMERVPGRDLKRRLAAGERFGTTQVLAVAQQLLAALGYAHARDVVHRDVKPANVMLQDDGQVKLCDFGVARLTDGDATRTLGGVVGTLRYASPEQIAGGAVDARTDLYAAAALLRELFGGEPPAAIDAVLQRALTADPAQRFDSAESFAAALQRAGTTAPPPRRSRRLWGAALLLPLAAAGAWLVWPRPTVAPAPVAASPGSAASAAATAASIATAATAAAPPPSGPAAPPAKAAPLLLDGPWTGLYACGETLGARTPGVNTEAFSAKIALDIAGSRISWRRSGKSHGESVIGSIDGRGRFTAEGEGWEDAPGRKSRWRVQASGQYNVKTQPARLEGEVRLLRSKDGTLARSCTLSAVPR